MSFGGYIYMAGVYTPTIIKGIDARLTHRRMRGMKIYTFKVVIEEGSDEFWESLGEKSGCDEIRLGVVAALAEHGFQEGYGTSVTLTQYEQTEG